MNLQNIKDALLPIAAIWTICPVVLGIVWLLAEAFGPIVIPFIFVGTGILAGIGWLVIDRYQKRKAAEAKSQDEA